MGENLGHFYSATARNATHGIAKTFCPSVCLSVRPSIKHLNCEKTKENCPHLLIPHESSFILIS